ncbi:uncharacterized protein LOC125031233 isoform X1 [Penaeus chinensis]|uniref:uncharacterized protein LOC125031233 isoform X1 n=1 Tax=Penaeus chinensis TaxID=139456 RepID=UPI001FB7AA4F|nr:uncharacterized protein LOC125031233 isoform X1 [Penaeus chinensis]
MVATAWRSLALCRQVCLAPRGKTVPPVVLRGRGTSGSHGTRPLLTARGLLTTSPSYAHDPTAPDGPPSHPQLQHGRSRLKFYSSGESRTEPPGGDQALVLLFSWLLAPERHIKKYVDMYRRRGVSVLTVTITPLDLLLPARGSQVIALNLLRLLQENGKYRPLLVHGFSVGAYVFSEAMVHVMKDRRQFGSLLERFVGQVWDCPVDLNGIPTGFPKAVTSIPRLQRLLRAFVVIYLRLMHRWATVHYEQARVPFFTNTVGVPALLLQSRRDPVSTQEMTRELLRGWRGQGTKVHYKCFEEGAHVSLYWKNPVEYEQALSEFLEEVQLLEKNPRSSSESKSDSASEGSLGS